MTPSPAAPYRVRRAFGRGGGLTERGDDDRDSEGNTHAGTTEMWAGVCYDRPMQYECKACGWTGSVNGRPRCLECYRKRVKDWRARNPTKAREQRRRWEKKFRDERPDEYNRRRRLKRSKERLKEAYRKRREWLASGDVTRDELKQIYRRDGGACVYCGVKVAGVRYTPTDPRGFDHVRPRTKGGLHTASNIVVCCPQCNAVKSG